ncbi:uncharacterized protein LOC129595244 [Paramacrobiotus metropolitanus]|uniref:uncharacterized protein LOC129595244 n=1 Tax=Paramacrobiotus metropolitanus TaxID=2943436 RepID=UPI002445B253|nr:uncharacterized protein LOC129595244 [Paramacrobiotus metropolitanus]
MSRSCSCVEVLCEAEPRQNKRVKRSAVHCKCQKPKLGKKSKHPLVPEQSNRAAGDPAVLIPEDLPRCSIEALISRYPLLQTQFTTVVIRGKELRHAGVFLPRALNYSLTHRRLAALIPCRQRKKVDKKLNLERCVAQLRERVKTAGAVVEQVAINRSEPVTSDSRHPAKGGSRVRLFVVVYGSSDCNKENEINGGLNPEANDDSVMEVVMNEHSPSDDAEVGYEYVLIYPAGESYQVCDMAILSNTWRPAGGHVCLVCRMRCDSLIHLIRHLEGLHRSVGCEYDPELKRLYIWFAPEHEFTRDPVAGMLDRWELARSRRPFGVPTHYKKAQPVMCWTGPKFVRPENRVADTLPVFSMRNILTVYGVPITPLRHHLHSNTVQPIRPDRLHMVEHDSDDEHDKIIDCSPAEKQLMCQWNTFTRPFNPVFSIGLKDLLCRFVQQHCAGLDAGEAFAPLCAQLSVLRRLRCLTQEEALQVIRVWRAAQRCDGYAMEQLKRN